MIRTFISRILHFKQTPQLPTPYPLEKLFRLIQILLFGIINADGRASLIKI